MGFPTRIIDTAAWLLVTALLGSLGAASAGAHTIERTAIRELVRLQGYVDPASAAEEVIRLSVRGRDLSFRITDRQVFITVGAAGRPAEKEPPRLVLQGSRELLARVEGARPEQRVTLLGERRPGGTELFLAAVDLCPTGVP